jgi:hypothetical protein
VKSYRRCVSQYQWGAQALGRCRGQTARRRDRRRCRYLPIATDIRRCRPLGNARRCRSRIWRSRARMRPAQCFHSAGRELASIYIRCAPEHITYGECRVDEIVGRRLRLRPSGGYRTALKEPYGDLPRKCSFIYLVGPQVEALKTPQLGTNQ